MWLASYLCLLTHSTGACLLVLGSMIHFHRRANNFSSNHIHGRFWRVVCECSHADIPLDFQPLLDTLYELMERTRLHYKQFVIQSSPVTAVCCTVIVEILHLIRPESHFWFRTSNDRGVRNCISVLLTLFTYKTLSTMYVENKLFSKIHRPNNPSTIFTWAPLWTRILSAYTPTWHNAVSTIYSTLR